MEMIVGLESNSKIFTVSVQGLLELQVSSSQTQADTKHVCNHSASIGMFFLRRLGSTPPYLWIMQQAPPSQYRTARISWACCSAYSLTPQGLIRVQIHPPLQFHQLNGQLTSTTTQKRTTGEVWRNFDLTACQTVRGQRKELKDCFSQLTAASRRSSDWRPFAPPISYAEKNKTKQKNAAIMSVSVYFFPRVLKTSKKHTKNHVLRVLWCLLGLREHERASACLMYTPMFLFLYTCVIMHKLMKYYFLAMN